MDAELKRLHSPDIYDLEHYQPKNPENFGFILQAMVGPEGMEGEESFDIEICTPRWLEDTYSIKEIIIGRHHLIVREYNYHRIIATIKNFLQDCSGENWSEVAKKVSRLGRWEFEDYTE